MARLDLGVLVLGMIGGLLCFVLAYGHAVWRARRSSARGGAPSRSSSVLSAISWTCAVLAVAVLILGISSRSLSEMDGVLSGEDLFAVKPRPGLVASYVATGPNVRRGDVLLRFRGVDDQPQGADGNDARVSTLDLDPEIVRHAQAADLAYRQAEERERQLISERDGIEREAAQQRTEITARRFRVAQDKRTTEGELAQTQANLSSENEQLAATKTLVDQRLVARLDLTKKQETVTVLEEHSAELEGRRALLGQEMAKTQAERGEMERIYAQQLGARQEELKDVTVTLENARRERDRWHTALELDRQRASVVAAPWDGRIGFREPSPASLPADGGPLLVQYRPGKIFVVVRLDSALTSGARAGLDSQFRLATGTSPAFLGGRATRSEQATDPGELRIPCDPPDRVIRQLALGGAVPVRAQLRLPLASAPGLWLATTLLAIALASRVARALVARAARVVAVASTAPAAEVVPFSVEPAKPGPATAAETPSPARADEVEDAGDDGALETPSDAVDSSQSVGS